LPANSLIFAVIAEVSFGAWAAVADDENERPQWGRKGHSQREGSETVMRRFRTLAEAAKFDTFSGPSTR
jgi:hypothetical protein